MNKTYFLEKETIDHSKIEYQFLPVYNGIEINHYSKAVIKQFCDLLDFYHFDKDEHISIIRPRFDDNRNMTLEIDLKFGRESLSHIRSKIGVLQKLKGLPRNFPVYGKVGVYNNFIMYNIDDEIKEDLPGVYLFSVLVEDDRPSIQFSHAIMKLESIADTNWNSKVYAKENGALHYAFYSTNSETERQRIISDIKVGENFQYQQSKYPSLFIPDLLP